MTKTYRQLIEFINAASNYLRTHPQKSKFEYALSKVTKKALSAYDKYNEALEDARIENCATDAAGVILRDDRNNYKFDKKGLTAFNKVQRALAETPVTIEPHIVDEAPALADSDKEIFEGLVIGPDTKFAEPEKTDAAS